jgi:NADH-quinone oxidoreductase subunit J
MVVSILFGLFTIMAISCALGTVFHRNPVHCALFLVGVLLSMSGMFIILNAQFIAAIQILVYAGAIMVLFLFVLMMLNIRGEQPYLAAGAAKGFGILFGAVALAELLWIVLAPGVEDWRPGPAPALPPGFGSPAAIGRILYTSWLYPFEVTSILLLVAVIGAVVLARRKFE